MFDYLVPSWRNSLGSIREVYGGVPLGSGFAVLKAQAIPRISLPHGCVLRCKILATAPVPCQADCCHAPHHDDVSPAGYLTESKCSKKECTCAYVHTAHTCACIHSGTVKC